MWRKLYQLVAPFAAIAEELKNLRELYELELSERYKIYRRTEEPKETDTEVSYTGEKVKTEVEWPDEFPERWDRDVL